MATGWNCSERDELEEAGKEARVKGVGQQLTHLSMS